MGSRVVLNDGTPATVAAVDYAAGTATLDLNHPLAGKTVIISVTLLGCEQVTKAEAEEMSPLRAEEKARWEAEEILRLKAEEKAHWVAPKLAAEPEGMVRSSSAASLELEAKARHVEGEEKTRLEAARLKVREKTRLEAEIQKARLEAEEAVRLEPKEKHRLAAELEAEAERLRSSAARLEREAVRLRRHSQS